MTEPLLKTPIEFLKGVGTQRASVLQKELGIFTFEDLLSYYPFRYIDRTRYYKIRELHAELPAVQILGRVISKELVGDRKAKRVVVQFKDDTGIIELVWFQSLRWIEKTVQVGQVFVVFGKPSVFNGRISISHPELETYDPKSPGKGNLCLQPVYNSTEKLKQFNLDTRGIQRIQANLIDQVIKSIAETLPDYIRDSMKLCSLQRAFYNIHFPDTLSSLQSAQRRLKFEELFLIQLRLLRTKLLRSQKFKGPLFKTVGKRFNTFYSNHLPFNLTQAQMRVIREIRQDTQKGAQMNRLLQGDVGSGKTVVALMIMLLAIDNDYQACLMAPTEILAQQHFLSIKELLQDDLARVELLTGSVPKKSRRVIHEGLENGEVQILIGTHALIEEAVKFKALGLVVIDEQHRFGVEQRAKLWKKSILPPHILVMTATPIPRTLAMTLYGDLDISVINELPAGRKPIKTVHFYQSQRLRMFGLMKEEVAKGRQIYIVYPLIKESEKLDLLYLEAGIEAISRIFSPPDYQISIVHGKLRAKDKSFEMERFVKGQTQIMVATTVIEVGVNVPNASVMIIENSERFGLSQLHQLRGRVGRGAEQSYCILMTGDKLSADSRLRVETMVRTNDGFEIAETDLQIRGPGNIVGTQQSGVHGLKLADLATDQSLLIEVRDTVSQILELDPELNRQENLLLRRLFDRKPGDFGWDKIS